MDDKRRVVASDGSELKPGMMVLGRDSFTEWTVDLFSHISSSDRPFEFVCAGTRYELCIPFEGNEHMVGSKCDVPNREKPFEWGERVLVWDRPCEEKREAIFVKYIDDPAPEDDKHRWLVLEKGEEDVLGLFAFCERAII